jgi:membrane protein DedA with SNARE-associated domain
MASVITEYASWILFIWILANQGGVPVPVMPALLGAGALAGSGRLSIAVILAVAVGATLCADLGWYSLGRWRGARALDVLGRVSPRAERYVRCAEHVFLGHARTFQLGARFLPELNPIAAGLAGVSHLSLARFLGYGAMSALAWAGAWVTLGYLLSRTLTEISAYFEIPLLGLGVASLLLYMLVWRARRRRLLRTLRAARMKPDDLRARLDECVRTARRRRLDDWSSNFTRPPRVASGGTTERDARGPFPVAAGLTEWSPPTRHVAPRRDLEPAVPPRVAVVRHSERLRLAAGLLMEGATRPAGGEIADESGPGRDGGHRHHSGSLDRRRSLLVFGVDGRLLRAGLFPLTALRGPAREATPARVHPPSRAGPLVGYETSRF